MKTGLVLEGGACRGIFTTGVLDCFLEKNLTFDYCIGVSAGAGNAMNFKSRQPGRVCALTAGDVEYYGLTTLPRTGNLIDLDFLYGTLSFEGDRPFDFKTYYENPMVCEYVVTNCMTAQPMYLSENVYQNRLVDIVKASSAMPGICHPQMVDEIPCLDGGIGDPLPVFRAMGQGCDRVVLVTTKPIDTIHPTDYTKLRPVLSKLYKKRFPQFYEALMTRVKRYFAQMDEIMELEKEGQIYVIRPKVCEVKSLERDKEKMMGYYHHGIHQAEKHWEELMTYLK